MHQNYRMRIGGLLGAAAAFVFAASFGIPAAQAQVPPQIEAKLQEMGHIVAPVCVAELYRPLMPKNDISSGLKQPYPGIDVTRNLSFGPDPLDAIDVYVADKGAASRTVLIYITGGPGNKTLSQSKAANAFYDNIGRWATENGMVGVLMQRKAGKTWDDPGKDVAHMIEWLQANISKYHGNPDHMVIWAQSAGNGPLGIYAGHPELWTPRGIGVKGIIFMSGQFDILPVTYKNAFGRLGSTTMKNGEICGGREIMSQKGLLPGAAPGTPGGKRIDLGPRPPEKLDAKTMLERSSWPGLAKTDAKIMLASAELDPGAEGGPIPFNTALHDALCKLGPSHCPTLLYEKGESHISEVMSIGTADKTVSEPILKWIESVK